MFPLASIFLNYYENYEPESRNFSSREELVQKAIKVKKQTTLK
jgi:hypothetical protein